MEHSHAVLQDAGNAIEGASKSQQEAPVQSSKMDSAEHKNQSNDKSSDRDRDQRKRKGNFKDSRMQHGSRGGRGGGGGGRNDNKRHKKGDMGRSEYL